MENKQSNADVIHNLLHLQLLISWAADNEEPPENLTHLGDSAEVEDTLVFQAG